MWYYIIVFGIKKIFKILTKRPTRFGSPLSRNAGATPTANAVDYLDNGHWTVVLRHIGDNLTAFTLTFAYSSMDAKRT